MVKWCGELKHPQYQARVDEAFVVHSLKAYLEKKGYQVVTNSYGVDILAIKGDERLCVECKSGYGSEQLYLVIGQIVSRIDLFAPKTNYGIALSSSLASYFYSWDSVGGLKLLNLHLFIIYPDGSVEHKPPEEFIEFVRIKDRCEICGAVTYTRDGLLHHKHSPTT
jgi:hypothetical protein